MKDFRSMDTSYQFDCVICGTLCCDILVRPFPSGGGISSSELVIVEPIEPTTGGLVANTAIAMARFGKQVAAFSYVGNDPWGSFVRDLLVANQVDIHRLLIHPTQPTSTTLVMVDVNGERSFAHSPAVMTKFLKDEFWQHMDLFERSRMALVGYYSLMPELDQELPSILREIRRAGCRTVMDAAGSGGTMQPLDRILPELDVYFPSLAEAQHQTGKSDPHEIVDTYRDCGAPGLLGVKLGEKGALLSSRSGEYLTIPAVSAPGPIVDTTGAGDSFLAGMLTGLLADLSLEECGRLAAAAGACCVTAAGASAGIRSLKETMILARSTT